MIISNGNNVVIAGLPPDGTNKIANVLLAESQVYESSFALISASILL